MRLLGAPAPLTPEPHAMANGCILIHLWGQVLMELGLKSHYAAQDRASYPSPAHASLPTAVWARPLLLHAALLSLAHVPGQPHALNAIRPGTSTLSTS